MQTFLNHDLPRQDHLPRCHLPGRTYIALMDVYLDAVFSPAIYQAHHF